MMQLLKSNPVGQLCPPTQIGEWWIILRLEKYIASQLDETLRQRLRNDLFQKWLANQIQTIVDYHPPRGVTPSPDSPAAVETQARNDDGLLVSTADVWGD
jgi:hypothetical protein